MRDGHSLSELVVALFLATLLIPPGAGALRALRDRAAVVAVREETAALLVRARAEARLRGGASVVVFPDPLRLRLVAGGDTLTGSNPGESFRVEQVGADGAPAVGEVEITYDALGIGRMASATLRFRRGRAVSSLVVSSLGRVTR